MTADPSVYTKLFSFTGALSALAMAASGWWRGGPQEDEVIAEACGLVIDSIADADAVGQIDAVTGQNVRDQLTVEDLEQMARDRNWHACPRRN